MLAPDRQPDLHQRVQQAAQLGGILGAAARHHLARPGKQVRGGLAAKVAEVLGADPDPALQLGVACELLHNASLVHDDIQDGDVLRRGRETVWVRFGKPVAINLGDHLLAAAFRTLATLSAPGECRARLVERFASATSVIARGQSDEILRREDLELERSRYERMARDKTGPLLALPLEAAAILSGLDEESMSRLSDGGMLLGTAYQIADDVADLFDRKERGEAGADLREGKLTWPTIDFLDGATSSVRDGLLKLLARRERTADVGFWVTAIRDSGAVERAIVRIRELVVQSKMRWATLPSACTTLLDREASRFVDRLPDARTGAEMRDTMFEVAR